MCEVGTVAKTSDCQPKCPGFNPWPGRGLNFGQPSQSRHSIGGFKRTYTLVDKSRLMPVLWTVTSLQKEPGLEGTMCPIACDPTEYHTRQMLKIC